MDIWTYGDGLDRVVSDLDLTNETFIQDDEMVGYFNEALAVANAEIMKLKGEDYYLKSCSGVLTSGQSQLKFTGTDYLGASFTNANFPPDIYANKLRMLIYQNDSDIYEVKRIRGINTFLDLAVTNYNPVGTIPYRYLMTNPTSQGYRLDIAPVSRDTGALITAYYLRHLVKIPKVTTGSLAASRATVIDLPEFNDYIVWYVKCLCLPKEGDPRLADALVALAAAKDRMIATLTEKVQDNDTKMIMDLRDYTEHC